MVIPVDRNQRENVKFVSPINNPLVANDVALFPEVDECRFRDRCKPGIIRHKAVVGPVNQLLVPKDEVRILGWLAKGGKGGIVLAL